MIFQFQTFFSHMSVLVLCFGLSVLLVCIFGVTRSPLEIPIDYFKSSCTVP